MKTISPKVEKAIYLPCDDRCCTLVIRKDIWDENDIDYEILVEDAYYYAYNGFVGRIKRAIKALFGKPIVYNGLYLEGEEMIEHLISDLKYLRNVKLNEIGENNDD